MKISIGLSNKKMIAFLATAFVTSFCIMVVELIAGRIVARYLGASLSTWTSVIGIVLIGIVIGNYAGGYLADRYPPRKILCALFLCASVSCLMVPLLNRLIGEWYALWPLAWPLRITVHIMGVFLLPSVMLGGVAPVVTKAALEMGWAPGMTIGQVYASGALGSIAGTFITGFLLIPAVGSLAIIYSVAVVLAFCGVLYSLRSKLSGVSAIFFLLMSLVLSMPLAGSNGFAQGISLFEEANPAVIYQKESGYSFITVEQSQRHPQLRTLIIDRLLHSVVDMSDPADIDSSFQYPYIRLYGSLTRMLSGEEGALRVLVLGGGGYVFPRYVQKQWPGSLIDVVEIDPEITRTAQRMLGLVLSQGIRVHHMDARNYVDSLLSRVDSAGEQAVYDFIYCDAVSGFSVPYQLTTREFMGKLKRLLGARGIFMLTVIDNYRSGRFLSAMVRTIKKEFSHCRVFSAETLAESEYARNTFTVVCSQRPLDLSGYGHDGFSGRLLSEEEVSRLEGRTDLVLTDDYAPVDNLIEPLIKEREREFVAARLTDRANAHAKEKQYAKALADYRKALQVLPDSFMAHNNLGSVLAQMGEPDAALFHFHESVRTAPAYPDAYSNIASLLAVRGDFQGAQEYYKKALKAAPDLADLHYNLASLLADEGRIEEAADYYRAAITLRGNFTEALVGLGNLLISAGDLEQAQELYRKALESRPDYAQAHNNLGVLLLEQGRLEEAIASFEAALAAAPQYGDARRNLDSARSRQEKRR